MSETQPNDATTHLRRFAFCLTFLALSACGGGGTDTSAEVNNPDSTDPAVSAALNIDMSAPLNYASPSLPVHYDAEVMGASNTPNNNPITNAGATLGRVLFYDKRLSINNTVACASCHQASLGFDDNQRLSLGFDGISTTTAHAMRLANSRFYLGGNGSGQMFWDRRAASLEAQATEPIVNSVEMGFDADHGGLAALVDKMATLTYYPPLFAWAFGDSTITQERIQAALAQFQRAMVSSNSAWDTAYATVYVNTGNKNIGTPLPQLGASEERGRRLFMLPRNNGGAGCAACHVPPTFALAANSRSNGLDAGETTVFKSPSLKNVGLSSHFMHDGRFNSLAQVMAHYASGIADGPARDNRLPVGGLGLSAQDQSDLVAFMHTLTDTSLNNDARFSDPFIR